MAYPYLPVNPCCTDVVINDPCGCSSTYTNSGCNNNSPCSTHLTASSTIVYDGPALTCTTAEPCDTLNVILQKIDEIICNLVAQVNYLTNQVNNITTQVIAINGDIINIYNTLDVCCSATTTTTSTTIATPCESFSLDNTGTEPVAIIITDCVTGEQEAIVLMPGETNICVETDSPLTVPGSVIVTPNGPCGTTTTTTTIVPTTTTTTTAYACECLTFYNRDNSIHTITYTDCNGSVIGPINIDPDQTIQVCGCCGEASDSLVTISVGASCIDGTCPSPTTTTTTTAACECYDTEITITSEGLAVTDDGKITVLYNDCVTNPFILTYDTPGVYSLGCVNYLVGIVALATINGTESSVSIPISTGAPCCDTPTTTTTTTITPTTTTTTTAVGPLRYFYNATFYNCGDCVTPSGAGSFNNSQPLTPGRYYINSSGIIIYINSFNSVSPGTSVNNILDSSQQVNCGDIICPTTTTTTTVEPTTTTTTLSPA